MNRSAKLASLVKRLQAIADELNEIGQEKAAERLEAIVRHLDQQREAGK